MSEWIVRFSRRQRVEHLLTMVLFVVLAVTGLPQKYFESSWAEWVVAAIGTLERVRWIHRLAGILFGLLLVTHLVTVSVLTVTGRAALTLVPTRKDFADAVTQLRYYLGVSDEQARCGRFDYRQKFEYWGLLLGGVAMTLTGLILYLPIQTARVAPGELIPVAKVVHSNEGLLALLVVVVWHIYNAHLAPEVFPMDTSIFTGRISRERMQHEHPLEYEAILAQQRRAAEAAAAGEGAQAGAAPAGNVLEDPERAEARDRVSPLEP